MPTTHGEQVGIKVDASKAMAKLGRLSAGLAVRDVLDGIGAKLLYVTGIILQKAGQAPGGLPWQKMAPLTIALRPLRSSPYHFSSPYQTLLQQSMVSVVSEATASVSVGTNARYAKDHHFGMPSKNLPARKLLPEPGFARSEAAKTVQAIVDQVLRSLPR
jgi:hypothetical protein